MCAIQPTIKKKPLSLVAHLHSAEERNNACIGLPEQILAALCSGNILGSNKGGRGTERSQVGRGSLSF